MVFTAAVLLSSDRTHSATRTESLYVEAAKIIETQTSTQELGALFQDRAGEAVLYHTNRPAYLLRMNFFDQSPRTLEPYFSQTLENPKITWAAILLADPAGPSRLPELTTYLHLHGWTRQVSESTLLTPTEKREVGHLWIFKRK